MLLLCKRNSIAPVALPVGEIKDLYVPSLRIISFGCGVIRGVIVVSVRIVGDGEKNRDKRAEGSFFVNNKSSCRIFVRLIGVEKLVLIVRGCDVKRGFCAMSSIN